MTRYLGKLLLPLVLAVFATMPARAETAHHPLAGRIWSTGDRAFISEKRLAEELLRGRYVLLGETHDNPEHHRIQAWAVATVAAWGRPGIALEMIRADRQPVIDAHFASRPNDIAGLGAVLQWQRTGWPEWSLYAAVIAPVIATTGPLIAADLPADAMRAIARSGMAALASDRRTALGLDRPLPDTLYTELDREMVASHCGKLPKAKIRPFSMMQAARDASLADGLLTAARLSKGRAVLIAGTGHVRRDRGVPMHLARRGNNDGIVVLAPIETQPGMNQPEAYAAIFASAALPFDYVWFTAAIKRGDPCGDFKAR